MKADRIRVELLPLGETLELEPGTPLQDVLFTHGVEFPCGGKGLCKGCKVKVLQGSLEPTPEDRHKLSPEEIAHGFRLACRAIAQTDLRLELPQWEAPILSDDSSFVFKPREGLGIAVDLGTTTVVAQLVDRQTGYVLAVRSALNQQAKHGADIMSRIEFGVSEGGQGTLTRLIRDQIGGLALELLGELRQEDAAVREIVLVGNTAMHHLFCGLDIAPLSQYPFETPSPDLKMFSAEDLGWRIPGNPQIHFLPCLGGFVGSDILAVRIVRRMSQ